ncbi:MAG: FkbM family methyltransferase [Bacteroidota bacterium]|nr:FkbM family methyltransferase [Bacteroidota bacterium]MDP3144478.1 FkbM family methyltransferase [Bacteroidota bacterium]MDP3555844.1 FkbM family methyltransferase [Bacteroidota bacterium]
MLNLVLSLIDKEHLVEYYQLKHNEPKILPSISNFYSGFITPNMKIIDVGANVGNYSQVFLTLGAKVLGLEPQKYCQKILEKRFKNSINFKLIPLASGAKESIEKIHKSNSHTIASMNKNWIDNVKKSDRFNGEDWNKTETISVTTIDNIIKENFCPDYIKIDVEGFELDVLKGLSHSVEYISFEITLPEMKQTAIDCVNEIGRIGNYLYSIPEAEKVIDIKNWQTKTEIILYLESLSQNSEKISADIFCKKS